MKKIKYWFIRGYYRYFTNKILISIGHRRNVSEPDYFNELGGVYLVTELGGIRYKYVYLGNNWILRVLEGYDW